MVWNGLLLGFHGSTAFQSYRIHEAFPVAASFPELLRRLQLKHRKKNGFWGGNSQEPPTFDGKTM